MRVTLFLCLGCLVPIVACQPDDKCGGELYFDTIEFACRPCPKGATFKNGSCRCEPQYEFIGNQCVLMDGAVVEVPDAGDEGDGGNANYTGAAAASCGDYCDFAKACLGDNGLAAAALSDVVAGLHADDVSACSSSCQSDLGGDGSADPVVACIQAGREAAACAGDSSQAGLAAALTLIGDCCRPHADNALCKSICKTLKANPLVANQIDFCD